MKKLLLGAVVLLGMTAVKAQETKFGVKAGGVMSTMKIDNELDDFGARSMKPKYSFYVGGLVEHKFNDKIAVQAELLYSMLGAKENISGEEGGMYFGEQSKITMGTILLPISAKYYIVDRFSVSAGASFGYIISAKQKTVIGTNLPVDLEIEGGGEQDIKNDLKSLNIAPFIGVEYNLENGLFFDARYNLGITNLNKNGAGSAKNSFAQVGIGFKFGGN